MNLIGCLDTPSSGQYILNNQNVSDLTESQLAEIRNKEIGFVFQTFNLCREPPHWKILLCPMRIFKGRT